MKPKADPSKTLAIILIGACLMLLVDLFVLDGKSIIWPPKNHKEISKVEIERLKDQHSKYLDEGVLAPAQTSPKEQDRFIKQVNLEPENPEGRETVAGLPYEEFYYNAPSVNPNEITPASGSETNTPTEGEQHSLADPYFKTQLQPYIDEDAKENVPVDLPQLFPEKNEKKPTSAESMPGKEPEPVKLAAVRPKAIAPQIEEPHRQTPAPVKEKTHIKSGTVVIIIDDMGLSSHSRDVENLPGPLTLSYLPYAEGLPARTAYAKRRGHELMLHMPMQPINSDVDGGPTLLRSDQSDEKFRSLLLYNLERFDGFVGINNHMGSKLTTNRKAMKVVMEELKKRGLYFVDSKTIGSSVAAQVASETGLKFAERDIFLDHEISLSFVRNALQKVEMTANQKGYAIAIGHPHEVTIQALKEWLPTLKNKGLTLRPASAVVHFGPQAILVAHRQETQLQKTEQVPEASKMERLPETEEMQAAPAPEGQTGFLVKEDGSIVIP